MECAKAAAEIAAAPACDPARGGRPMIFLNIGEPDFTAPPLVQEAAARALRAGRTQYTHATGLPALRERISGWYRERFGARRPAAPHRRHGRRVGRAAAGLPGAGRAAATRCCCPTRATRATATSSPPPTARAVLLPTTAASSASSSSAANGRRGLDRAHARRAAGLAVQPDRHLDRPGRDAPHRRRRARARRHHAGRRDLPRPELRRALRPQRAARRWRRRRDLRSTASPSTSA